MKHCLLLFLCIIHVVSCTNQTQPQISNPLVCDNEPIILGDPFIYEHENRYYLTGTYGTTNDGFPCYISDDLIHWEFHGMLWEKSDDCWASGAFWAPEVKFYNGKFYLTYSGVSKSLDGLRIALAVSDKPEGPFTDLHAPWFDYGFGAIDGHIFTDGDQPYLFFSMNGAEDGYSFGITYGVQLAKDLSRPVGDTVRLIEASQDWERVNWEQNRCNEGPFVFKHNDTYYMTYSANHTFEPNYGIGYATAPTPLGPWTKATENPIAGKVASLNITGIGHNSLLPTKNKNEWLIIYHTHADPAHPENQKRHANIGLLQMNNDGRLQFHPQTTPQNTFAKLENGFMNPPDSARPGVYWYFMDGNLSKEAMTKDLESMKKAGIGYLVYLEVNVGVPRGKVDFLSQEWKALFKHAVEECERLGIAITLGVGPGWTGSGGPWVDAAASMRHLVASSVEVKGDSKQQISLPLPQPKRPFFGEGGFTSGVREQWDAYYEDVAVLAFPTPVGQTPITDSEEKALYYRAPYSSQPGVKQFLPPPTDPKDTDAAKAIASADIVDLTALLNDDGIIIWDVPTGNWTIMRFGSRNNGAVTRPAPLPGVGLEADKFDTLALNAHLEKFTGELFRTMGNRNQQLPGGLKMLHMDSWEMGAQNWTDQFRQEFINRRKYDPQPFYPVYAGLVVESREISERFLWDLRLTSQELILENHAGHIKEYGRRHGYGLSIEPYDMNPTADLELAAVADMPMCEFWSVGYGFNTSFSAMEGTSAAHLLGQPVVPAEAFTAHLDGWRQHPGSMKNQSDWAFASGINRLVYHTFQHQALDDKLRPGMTMGPYGVHWDRNQTWWPMADAYHRYVARCQLMLQQGRTVADILYLTPENAPHVFRAPESALACEEPFLPDRKGYNFDGCPPSLLHRATVRDNRIVFPSGASYRLLVLPDYETMTPELLRKIKKLVQDGATIVGLPPVKAPGLTGYPDCDTEIESMTRDLWGSSDIPQQLTTRTVGKGEVIWGIELREQADNLYPNYHITTDILSSKKLPADFTTEASIRYTHRTLPDGDIYFVANRSDHRVSDHCFFRMKDYSPELWDPMTGKTRLLPEYSVTNEGIEIPLVFEPHESYFIVFHQKTTAPDGQNFYVQQKINSLDAPWEVSFDPAWGGPENIRFDRLTDWTQHPHKGIKYYSGTAVYKQTFDLSDKWGDRLFLNLGTVKNMARVRLNGKEVGTVWTSPWQIEITDFARPGSNQLEIEVVNLWPNRLIGDEQLPDDGIQHGQWPEWLQNGTPRTSGRYTFTTHRHYHKDSPLLESGLIGPVTIWKTERPTIPD